MTRRGGEAEERVDGLIMRVLFSRNEWRTINYNFTLRKTTCGVVHTMKSGKEEREREREKYRRIITTLGSAKFFSLGSTRNPRNR